MEVGREARTDGVKDGRQARTAGKYREGRERLGRGRTYVNCIFSNCVFNRLRTGKHLVDDIHFELLIYGSGNC